MVETTTENSEHQKDGWDLIYASEEQHRQKQAKIVDDKFLLVLFITGQNLFLYR